MVPLLHKVKSPQEIENNIISRVYNMFSFQFVGIFSFYENNNDLKEIKINANADRKCNQGTFYVIIT